MAESKTPFSSGDYSVLLGPKIFEIREGNQKMNALKKLLAKIKKLFLLNDVHYINGPETLPPPLSKKEEEKLLSDIRIGNGNDVEKARQALITHNLRLVVYIAKNLKIPVCR